MSAMIDDDRMAKDLNEQELIKLLVARVKGRAYRLAEESYEKSEGYMLGILTDVIDNLNDNRATVNLDLNKRIAIERLPDEVLGMIFVHCVDMRSTILNPRSIYACGPFKWPPIVNVCKRWRQTALNTPRLFTCCHMGWEKNDIDLILKCGGTKLPLHLSIPPIATPRVGPSRSFVPFLKFFPSPATTHPTMTLANDLEKLRPLITRSISLHLMVQEELIAAHPDGLDLSCPNLDTLLMHSMIHLGTMNTMNTEFRTRVKSLFGYLFRTPLVTLKHLHLESMDLPEDIHLCPNIKSVVMENTGSPRSGLLSTLQVLSKVPGLQKVTLNSCFAWGAIGIHPPPPAPSATLFRELTILSISKMHFTDISRMLSQVTFPNLKQLQLLSLIIFQLPDPYAHQIAPNVDFNHTDLKRFISQGTSLRLVLRGEGSSCDLTASLTNPDDMDTSSDKPKPLLEVSFAHERVLTFPADGGQPPVLPPDFSAFFECLKSLPFEDLRTLEIVSEDEGYKSLPGLATRSLLDKCRSLRSIHFKKINADSALTQFAEANVILCPGLEELVFDGCTMTGPLLENMLQSGGNGSRNLRSLRFLNTSFTPEGSEPDLTRYVTKVIVDNIEVS
ncbi:hypothetical protein SISSUDRAFT_1048979 [Sistotremastrum suecicum HHB10207 ss-3]|uniref:Uncharacterized protein n=1 Tax=Sistotremastrum suecicum HHB10207 ss-3 TaxID=1314776 RepID=A0A166C497_9AGAM|nr:hypothetical protein SISSUDRAFT_1048979 [Sistotremastrum suecicum HHB10207 ss-3]